MENMLDRDDFAVLGAADLNDTHEVIIAVKQLNMDKLEDMALQRSTPGSPLHQQWMTFAEVGELIQNDVGLAAVESWVSQFDVTVVKRTLRNEYLTISASVNTLNTMFNMTLLKFRDLKRDILSPVIVRSMDYYVPIPLKDHISTVLRICQLPPLMQHHSETRETFKSTSQIRARRLSTDQVTVSFIDSL